MVRLYCKKQLFCRFCKTIKKTVGFLQKHKFLRFFRDILRKNTCKCFALAYFYLYFNSSEFSLLFFYTKTFCERFVGLLPQRIFFENSHALLKFRVKMLANSKTFAPYNIIQARKLACKGFRAPCFKKCYRQIYLICLGVAKGNAIYEFYE